MPDPRGAASVTLDTIITDALLAHYEIQMDNQDHVADIQLAAMAVTDALIAKSRGPYRGFTAHGLWIPFDEPLEAS